MTMIKCSECGKDISDKASVCISCGAPTSSSPGVATGNTLAPTFGNLADLTGDGRVDFEDFKAAYSKIKESLPDVENTEDPKTD